MRSRSPWIAMLVVGVTALACDPFRASADEDPAPTAESDAAAPPSDGAAPDDAAAASALCEGTHFLCDDFGRGALGDPARWPRSENVAAFTFSTDAPKSAPRAIEVTGSDGAFAYLGKRHVRALPRGRPSAARQTRLHRGFHGYRWDGRRRTVQG